MEKENIYDKEYLKKNYKNKITSKKMITDKFCFYFILENGFEEIGFLSDLFDITKDEIEKRANSFKGIAPKEDKMIYVRKYNIFTKERSEKIQKGLYESNGITLYMKQIDKILEQETIDDAVEYLLFNGIPLGQLQYNSQSYVTRLLVLDETKAHKVEKKLKEIYDAYKEKIEKRADVRREAHYQKHLKKEFDIREKKRSRKIKLAEDFASSKIKTKKEFCKKNNIKIEELEQAITYVRNRKLEIADKIYEKISKNELNKEISNIRNIIGLITNGVNQNGEVRQFDLLDYYENSKLSFKDFSIALEKKANNIDEYRKIKEYIKRYAGKIKAAEKIIPTRLNISVKVNDKIYTSTEKDELDAVTYLKENNIPLLDIVYRQKLLRILRERAALDNAKKSVK